MANVFKGVATGCVPITGGYTSSLLLTQGSLRFNTNSYGNTEWARGVEYISPDGNIVGMLGAHGTASNVDKMYFGIGITPWSGSQSLTITSSDVLFNNTSLARTNGSYPNMSVGNASSVNRQQFSSWRTPIMYNTWSRIVKFAGGGIQGGSFLLNIGATRNAFVIEKTLLINYNHSGNFVVSELNDGGYSFINIRGVVEASNATGWIELLDTEASYSGTMEVRVTVNAIFPETTFEPIISFTNGDIIPSGYASAGEKWLGIGGMNADKLGTYLPSATTKTNSIPVRDDDGYTYFNYINSNIGVDNAVVSTFITTNPTDGFFRKSSLAHVKNSLGTMPANGGNADTVDGKHATDFYNNVAGYYPYGANYFTGDAVATGMVILTPFSVTQGSMVMFTINVYTGYQSYKILIQGYLYGAVNNWYSPSATYIAGTASGVRVVMGRWTDGRAYVYVSASIYLTLSISDITSGFNIGNWASGWTFIRGDGNLPNAVLDKTVYPPVFENDARLSNARPANGGTSTNSNQLGGIVAADYINTGDTLILKGTI